MTLILFKIPDAPNSTRLCKERFEFKYNLSEQKMSKYLTLDEAVFNYRGKNFYDKLINTRKFFGFQVNSGNIFVHPDNYYRDISRIEQKKLSQKFSQTPDPQHWN